MADRRTRGLPARDTERRLVKLATDAVLKDSTNPERVGCPDPEALDAVLRRRHSFPGFDNIVDHIATCAPCFKEYGRQQSRRRFRRNGALVLTCAAAILVGLYWTRPISEEPRSQATVARETPPNPTLATADYTAWSAVRSGSPRAQSGTAPKLPPARLDLTIRLPIGTEDGVYTVEFGSGRDEPIARATGKAVWDGTAEVLKVIIDLHRVPPGIYALTIRSSDSSVRSYPVVME
jgi:hypothetical protein